MNTTLGDFSGCQVVEQAAKSVRDSTGLEMAGFATHGCEGFHPDGGEYWKPAHVLVNGDMNDLEVLKQVSEICNKHGLKVHSKRGVSFSGEDHARLVVDHSA